MTTAGKNRTMIFGPKTDGTLRRRVTVATWPH